MRLSMKLRYTFSDGSSFEADADDLLRLLDDNRSYLRNYQELLNDLDDDAYIARGNGFCDRKYSDDFMEGQIAKYKQRVRELEQWIVRG